LNKYHQTSNPVDANKGLTTCNSSALIQKRLPIRYVGDRK